MVLKQILETQSQDETVQYTKLTKNSGTRRGGKCQPKYPGTHPTNQSIVSSYGGRVVSQSRTDTEECYQGVTFESLRVEILKNPTSLYDSKTSQNMHMVGIQSFTQDRQGCS
jgi:hypothetical protein